MAKRHDYREDQEQPSRGRRRQARIVDKESNTAEEDDCKRQSEEDSRDTIENGDGATQRR